MDGGSEAADEREYYEGVQEDCEAEAADRAPDPDFFPYSCLTPDLVDKMLNESIERLTDACQVTPSLAKVRCFFVCRLCSDVLWWMCVFARS